MQEVIEILKAIGEDTRIRILALLSHGEMTAGELSNVLCQSQPRVSRHIKLLYEAGVIDKRSEGSWVFVKLKSDKSIANLIDIILNMVPNSDFTIERDYTRLLEIKAQREEKAKLYFEEIAGEWEDLRKLHQPEEVENCLFSMVKSNEFDFHLDLGSGVGRLLEVFADKCEKSEGIDSSRGMLNIARTKFDEKGLKSINVRMGDILSLPYSDSSVDLLTIHQVLHYLEDPFACIKEAARVLSEDGIILLADFAPHNYENLRTQYGHRRLGFDEAEINNWCKQLNLEIIQYQEILSKLNNEALVVNVFKIAKIKTIFDRGI